MAAIADTVTDNGYSHYYRQPPYRAYIVTSPFSTGSTTLARPVQGHGPYAVYRERNPQTVPAPAAEPAQGWQLLEAGDYERSLSAFAQEATAAPDEGSAKVGYALAAAGAGQLERGVWAMRRAFRIDPNAAGDLHINEQLKPTLRQLARQYAYVPREFADEAGAAFMTAALYYLLHDPTEAQAALDLAEQLGDRKASTAQLQQLIAQQQQQKPAKDQN